MKRHLRLVALLSAFAALPGLAHATIIAGGNIINQTWTLAGSPYIVQGDITIPAGSTLTIQAGVDVRFAGTDALTSGIDASRVEVTVAAGGTLTVQGTSLQPVPLRADIGTSPSTWYGIVVSNGATDCHLQGAALSHAHRGIFNQAAAGIVRIEDSWFDVNAIDLSLGGGGAPTLGGSIQAGIITGAWAIPSGVRFELNRPLGTISAGGGFALANGAFYRTRLTSAVDYRKLQVIGGSVTLGGSLEMDLVSFSASVGQIFTLIDNFGSNPVSGTFAGLPEGAEFDYGSYRFQVSYAAGSGSNDVRLTVVEPTTCDLSLIKSAPAETLLAAGGLEYVLTVGNGGPGTAQDVTVRDSLPAGLRYVSATPSQGTCAENGGIVTCSLGNLAASATATVSIEVSFDFDSITVVNSAAATSSNTDVSPGNNEASAATVLVSATTSVAPGPGPGTGAARRLWAGPNPAAGATRVFFRAPAGSFAQLEIFDASGRRVRDMELQVGEESPAFRWDGKDAGGASVGPGVYYYRVRVDGRTIGAERSVLLH